MEKNLSKISQFDLKDFHLFYLIASLFVLGTCGCSMIMRSAGAAGGDGGMEKAVKPENTLFLAFEVDSALEIPSIFNEFSMIFI